MCGNKQTELLKYIGFVIIFMCLSSISLAQKSTVGNWLIYFGNQKIDKKWNLYNEVQLRNYNFLGDVNQLVIRVGLGYNLSENNDNILLGYGFIQAHNYTNITTKNTINEHRIYQQFLTKQNIHNFYLQHRYRIEERFFTNNFKMRFRYFLSVNKPLNKKLLEKNAIYFSAYNEIFLNAARPVFDRNRLYAGLGYCINKDLKFELGYMKQILENRNLSQFQIMFFNNISFSKN